MAAGVLAQWRERARRLAHGRRLRRPVGVALSGGGKLGAAHAGVLRALEERGVPVERLSGTSAGAIVAALYAFGTPIDEIERIAEDTTWLSISSFSPSWLGLLANRRLGDILRNAIGEPRFEDARIPLAVIATDISRGRRVVLDRGEVVPAVLASACVPGIFQPIEHEDQLLVDGGLVENVPTSVLRPMGARTVIAADVNSGREYEHPDDMIDVILNAIDIAINNATQLQTRDGVDLLITPELSSYGRFRSPRGAKLVAEGRAAAEEALRGWRGALRAPRGREETSAKKGTANGRE